MSAPSAIKAEFINTFIAATTKSFETMIYTKVRREKIYVKQPTQTNMGGDISVMMSIFGGIEGTVMLTFPRRLGIQLVSKMLMDESVDDMSDDVIDGIGEIGNLVCGTAKSAISSAFGMEARISIPTVITGKNHSIQHGEGIPCVGCIFAADPYRFALEVAVREGKN